MTQIDISRNRPILVFANYRCGSTALCDILSKQTGLPNLDEMFHPVHKQQFDYQTNNCIIKIMPDHQLPGDFDTLLQRSYIVGIKRKSIVNQIASFYTCHRTHIWHVKKNQTVDSYAVDIDNLDLEDQIAYMLSMQKIYDNYQFEKHTELYYEDIKNELNQSVYNEYTKPTNYSELVALIEQLLPEVKQRIENETN
jgi:LPS sulfotransferase NodH